VNLGTARIVIILALVVAGIAVLTNAFGPGTVALTPLDPGSSVGGSPSGAASTSASASHSPGLVLPSPETTGVLVSVFSGVSAAGCAHKVYGMLVADGYVGADPASDATHKPIAKTVVYYRPDPKHQNQADANSIAKTYFNSARVAKLPATFPGAVSGQAQAAVLIGADYASNC
jgi:hypothetical protein